MIIASAQTIPFSQNTEANIQSHIRLIELAAQHRAQLIVFPELSLTGYERELASELILSKHDPRLEVIKEKAALFNMIIITGAPVLLSGKLHIGSFIFFPDKSVSIYTKQYLHEGEELFFTPSFDHNPIFDVGGEKVSLAICADISHPDHSATANGNKVTLYVASIFYTPKGISSAYELLGRYAQKYYMNILMSNFGGPSYHFDAAGQSAFWNIEGQLVGKASPQGEELLIVEKLNGVWKTKVVNAL
jgi:predicted amidohydrolase